jgi:RNA polymerase sigma-70 factor (ECF subfamily)
MSRDSDAELVQQVIEERSPEAFRELYERYKKPVFNTAYRLLGNLALALDATQEVFLLVYRKMDKFDFRAAFSSWLYRCAVNVILDVGRKVKRDREVTFSDLHPEADGRELPFVEGETQPADRELVESETSRAVQRALLRLSPKLRTVMVLRYMEGLSYEQIAYALGQSVGTVKSRISRAHRQLKPWLARLVEEE